jgi:hypothetical protein
LDVPKQIPDLNFLAKGAIGPIFWNSFNHPQQLTFKN